MLLYVLVPPTNVSDPCSVVYKAGSLSSLVNIHMGINLTNGGTEDSNWKDFMCVNSKPTFADVPARVLDGGVAIDVGQQAETEAIFVVGGVREAVYQDAA